jgi:hypothetical protein
LGIFRPTEGIESKVPKKVKLEEEFWVELPGRPFFPSYITQN